MKLAGKDICRSTRTVTIERAGNEPLVFTVSSLSIGIRRDFDVLCPTPVAPKIVTESKNGRTEKEVWDDPKFIAAVEERQHLRNIYLLYRILESDKNVHFDNVPKDMESMRKLADEFAASGLSEGDMVVLLKEAMAASNLTKEEIAAAKSNF